MPGWNFADVWEVVAEQLPDAAAQVHGDRRVTWQEFDRRADGVARTLLDAGAAQQDKVALYLHNGPEYLEACFGAWKAGLVPVNTNYRYTEDELAYLWDNADAVAVVFHGTFTETGSRPSGTGCRRAHLAVGGRRLRPLPRLGHARTRRPPAGRRTASSPPGAAAATTCSCSTPGGTTGMPKGVMWRQHDLFVASRRRPSRSTATRPTSTSCGSWRRDAGPRAHPGLPAHARHRVVHRAHRA